MVLSPGEVSLLWEVRRSDEDHGGLRDLELHEEEYEAMQRLCDLGLVEGLGAYGEAPDGEEDEREMGNAAIAYRITAAGVNVLRDEVPPASR